MEPQMVFTSATHHLSPLQLTSHHHPHSRTYFRLGGLGTPGIPQVIRAVYYSSWAILASRRPIHCIVDHIDAQRIDLIS